MRYYHTPQLRLLGAHDPWAWRNTGNARRAREAAKKAGRAMEGSPFKKGGSVKSPASKRADGCAVRGKTKGRMV